MFLIILAMIVACEIVWKAIKITFKLVSSTKLQYKNCSKQIFDFRLKNGKQMNKNLKLESLQNLPLVIFAWLVLMLKLVIKSSQWMIETL